MGNCNITYLSEAEEYPSYEHKGEKEKETEGKKEKGKYVSIKKTIEEKRGQYPYGEVKEQGIEHEGGIYFVQKIS